MNAPPTPSSTSRRTAAVVIGAGVFGLTTALRLARAGLDVRILERAPAGPPNASAVAAGMLAPVSETLFEEGDAEHLRRLMIARDLWPAFAASVPGLALERSGVAIETEGATASQALLARLHSLGIQGGPLDPPSFGAAVAEDWRLDAPVALAALRGALKALGVDVETAAVSAGVNGRLLADGEAIEAEWIVVAAGFGARALAASAPELGTLSPIKGQLAAFSGGGRIGPMRRGQGVYLVPQPSGARAGATMEPGLSDADVAPAEIERMRAAAVTLSADLAPLAYRGEAGVRAATPDGWPLVGPSVTPGVVLATGARRNGWLLAPLVSQIALDAIIGDKPHPLAGGFHPGRFTR